MILHHFTTEWLETTNTPFELLTCRKIDRFNLTIQGWVYLEDCRIVRPGDECRIVVRRDELLLRMRGVVVTVDRREFEPDDPELGSPEDVEWLLIRHNWQNHRPEVDVLRMHVRLFAKQFGGRLL